MDKQFISYEYTQIPMNHKDLHFLLDCYESLGWEQDTRLEGDKHLTLRRSRKLVNHMELTRLQGHLEACLSQIEALEKSKTSKATSAAIGVGVLGTAFMAGSVFAVTAEPPVIWLCVMLAIPAFGLWIWAPLLFKDTLERRTLVVNRMVQNKRDEIYEICEKGSKLL